MIDAERVCLSEDVHRVSTIAHDLWERRGWPEDTSDRDWLEAEQIARWQNWVEAKLRPYLAILGRSDPVGTAEMLESQAASQNQVTMVACLDGSPEFSRHWFAILSASPNCKPPEEKIEAKDRTFYRLCATVLSYWGEHLVYDTRKQAASIEDTRIFQDCCPAVFGKCSDALLAAFRLRKLLREFNEANELDWDRQFHPRIAVGSGWISALRNVTFACRGDIVIDASIVESMESDPSKRQLIFEGAGLKVGFC